MSNYLSIILCLIFCFCSCTQNTARKPVMIKSNSFLVTSAQKNKAILKEQEILIDSVLNKKNIEQIITTKNGFKFYYILQNHNSTYTPLFGDKVDFTYQITNLNEEKIYQTIQNSSYFVDQQEVFKGLEMAIKLLKINEEAVFFFPSEIAFGYRGDKNLIGINEPIRVKIKINNITFKSNIK